MKFILEGLYCFLVRYKTAPFEINVYSYQEVENSEIVLSRWLGTEYQNKN